MIKCIKCGEEKDEDSFSWKETGKRRSRTCKQCKRAYNKTHYKNNLTRYLQNSKKHQGSAKKRQKQFIDAYLSGKVCVDCGEGRLPVLQFDHVRGEKLFCVRTWNKNKNPDRKNYHTLEEIKREIEKCDVRCSNCHIMRHHNERTFRAE